MNGVNYFAGKFRSCSRRRGMLGVWFLYVAGMLAATASAFAAPVSNQLLAVGMEKAAAAPTVLIQTAEAVGYRYTVYDSFDPVRVVVDFPGMAVANLPASITAGPAPLKELRVNKFDLASGSLTRVEIVLDDNAAYQVALDGNNFRVTFPDIAVAEVAAPASPATPATPAAPPAAPPAPPAVAPAAPPAPPAVAPAASPAAASGAVATIIDDVILTPGQALFATNGAIGRYEHFTLGNPPRLVVDLYGLRPGFKARNFNLSAGMKQIRVGAYGDKVRFVFDGEGKALPEHTVEKQAKGLAVTWGKGLQAAVPEAAAPASPVPATAEPAPLISEPAALARKPVPSGRQVSVEGLDFINRDGRSYVVLSLSAPANISQPVQDGNLVRFEVKNATISRALRRTVDASAFPSAVKAVTPYVATDDGQQAVRVAVELKGTVPFTLVDEGELVKLVVDDGAYAEAIPPAMTTREVVVPAQPVAVMEPLAEEIIPMQQGNRYTGQKISLVFDNADIRSILQLIGDVSGMNILASNDVKGDITLRLIDVPWDQALDLVLDTANLGKLQEGNVVRIMPADKIRERELAALKVKKEEVDEGVLETRAFPISYSKVDDVKKFLADLSSKRGSIIADSRNKQLIVKDVDFILDQMVEMIRRVDQPERQVMIEARIVEANTNFSRQLGVKWNFQSTDEFENEDWQNISAGLGGSFLIPVTTPAAAGGAANIVFGALDGKFDVDLRLSALETAGEGKIISTPRVTTLNGQKAVISQGTKIPYVTTSDTGTNVSFENAELKLDVTPEINPDGSVILDIKASNSAVGTVYQTSNGETPAIDEKKAETKVLVRDGQTTVIGGIFVENDRESDTGVPLLKDIPYLGHLFKSSSKSKERRELLIFITPRILES